MGEITEALRRAKLEDRKKEKLFRDSETANVQNPNRASDWGGPPLDEFPDDGIDPSISPAISPSRDASLDRSPGDLLTESEPEPEPELKPDPAPVADRTQYDAVRIEIPRTKTGHWIPRAVLIDPPLRAAEAFRHFAIRVNRELERRGQRAVLVTSALAQEGKTTVSCNLALAIASIASGRRTALVDLDLRRSSVGKAMGVTTCAGFERVLSGEIPLEAARVATDIPDFDVYPVAVPQNDAHQLLSGPQFQSTVNQLAQRYDCIVYDAPPVLPVPDVALAVNFIPTCVMVTRRGVTRRRLVSELLSIVPPEKFIGAFLNECREIGRPSHYAYGYETLEAEGDA